ncbi:MAG: hypothetical protein AAFN79_18425 [Pseudomonadota bacterium]
MQLDHRPRPTLSLASDREAPSLTLGRAHEATGPAALVFAALVAGRLSGPVLWARPARGAGALNPEGLAAFFDPSRLVVAHADRPIDVLWTAEEALRSGAAPLVVAEAAEPPALTPLRRLQLAAEAGGAAAKDFASNAPIETEGRRNLGNSDGYAAESVKAQAPALHRAPPLCLILSPRAGASGAVESRWRCAPLPQWEATGAPRWRFERIYAKAAPTLVWETGGEVSPLAA